MKRDLQSLQQQNDALDVIVDSLRTLPESEAVSLLQSLRSDTSPDYLAASLRANVSLPSSFSGQTLEADLAEQMIHLSNNWGIDTHAFAPSRSNSGDSQQLRGAQTPAEARATWFRAPQDAELVEHLLNLYFCWVHPFHHLFSRELFLYEMGHGRTQFCSALLVNALLSFACHYSDRPVAYADPSDTATAGDHFFAEAKWLLDNTELPSLTTVQALGIMSLRETSRGSDSNGYQYAGRCVRMALELGLHLSDFSSESRSSLLEARKVTYWGVFHLETYASPIPTYFLAEKLTPFRFCSIAVGRPSQLPRSAADIQKPIISERTENHIWRPYEDSNLARRPSSEQRTRSMLFFERLSKLSELASDIVNTFYAPQEHFTSRRLAAAHAQYQEWYNDLPDAFRIENTALPHVLVLHMYYYACVLQ